ncbi:Forkhead box protein C1-A [Holothuria leucospilota]|uniref:Forkhead box protein C1-A n=1 Tax=Holothuria leucospilota TaxID=206669 RepID=A0A9Q1H5T7_HOLLE|nr:Forkhead box protein C1-A [Holothuria leucospilota]
MEVFDVSLEFSRVEMCLQDMFPSLDHLSSSLKSDVIMPDLSPVVMDSRENILPSPQSYQGFPTYTDGTRPPYSFLDLTVMAIQNYPNNEATVQEIYDFISTSFPFFRDNILHWKNSVRHNLTVRPCFERRVYELKSDKRIVWRYIESFYGDNYKSLSENGILTPPPTPTNPSKDITLIPGSAYPLFTDEIQTPPSITTPPASPDSISSPNYVELLPPSYNKPSTNANALPQFSDLWSIVSSRPSFKKLRSLHRQQKLQGTQDGGNCRRTRRGNSTNTVSFPTNPNMTSPVLKDAELTDLDNGLQGMELDEENSFNTLQDDLKFLLDDVTTKKDNLLPTWALKFPLVTLR